jgi:hypothetical protein
MSQPMPETPHPPERLTTRRPELRAALAAIPLILTLTSRASAQDYGVYSKARKGKGKG